MTREEAIDIIINEIETRKISPGIALNMAIEALENWAYLKEQITEMRDANGALNQKQTCQFILNLMKVIENEGEAET